VTASRKPNRGPKAAAGNRQALVAAALEVFNEGGIEAPLSAVAKRAGVGQGSLYRHFPDRVSLALAAFEDNVTRLEAAAADPAATLDDLLAVVTGQIIDSVAFVDIVTPTVDDPRLDEVVERVRAAFAPALEAARAKATVRPTVSVDDLMLAIGLVAALVAKMPATNRRRTADDAWALLRGGLQP
jgi:AcrR family transcriptional regulator